MHLSLPCSPFPHLLFHPFNPFCHVFPVSNICGLFPNFSFVSSASPRPLSIISVLLWLTLWWASICSQTVSFISCLLSRPVSLSLFSSFFVMNDEFPVSISFFHHLGSPFSLRPFCSLCFPAAPMPIQIVSVSSGVTK